MSGNPVVEEEAQIKDMTNVVTPVASTTATEIIDNGKDKLEKTYSTGSQKHSIRRSTSKRRKNGTGAKNADEILVASSVHNANKLPVANSQGTIGSIPLEKVHPKEMKRVPSRNPNLRDTSISGPGLLDTISVEEKKAMTHSVLEDNAETLYPWRIIGEFHSSGKGVPNTVDSNEIKAYMIESFYNDWYYNMATVIGTCFFAWLLAYCGFSWWSLGLVFLGTSSVYNTEYRRFNRNVRDDLKRVTVEETLSDKTETTLWLNSFLSKFWVIYMPVLSQQVKDIVNPQLVDAAPGYGIDAISLDEFTLGSKAPAIRGIKTYTKSGKNIVEMDWSFAFTPNDVSDMTPIEAKEKINPKIALGVSIGKGVISKSMPILVENINCAGRMNIKLEFGKIFPNIKIVSVQFLEPPMIDFALKPIGGDTLGLDVMSFLPGLKSFVKSLIDSNVAPMLYAPNHLDINVEEIMAAQANDAIGVVAVNISSATDLKSSDFITNTVDPYVVLKTEKTLPGEETEIRTAIKSDVKNPTWHETKYILVNSLNQKLSLTCFDFNDVRKDTLIGSVDIDLNELFQTPSIEDKTSELLIGSKSRGMLNYSISWYPVIKSEKKTEKQEVDEETVGLSDAEDQDNDAIDSGIAKITLQKITDISSATSFTSNLSPSAKLYINDKLVKSFRTLKRINEPSWNETFEVLIGSKTNSTMTLKVFDNRGSNEVLLCQYSSNIEDGLNTLKSSDDFLTASPFGKIYIDAEWKPVEISDMVVSKSMVKDPIGCMRLNVGQALIKGSLKGMGDIDPYFVVTLNRHPKFKSKHFSDCMDPKFNQLVYVPIASSQQSLSISLYDYQSVGSDRFIGEVNFATSDIIELDKSTNTYTTKQNMNGKMIVANLNDKNKGRTPNTVELEFSFVPTQSVYSPTELEDVEKLEADLKERRDKFEDTQVHNKAEMDKNPDEWEVATIANPFEDDEKKINRKQKLSFDELISMNSGILVVQIVKGALSRPSSYLNIHVDDVIYPSFISTKFRGNRMASDVGYIFVRDLKYSKLLFRVSKKQVAKDQDDVISETYMDTMKVLKSGYNEPTKISFNGSTFSIQCAFYPTVNALPISETIADTGLLNLNIVSGTGLLSADRNGKSDPFVTIYVNRQKVFKSKTIKKTLDPVWNEKTSVRIQSLSRDELLFNVLDWDRTGDNDDLGVTILDMKSIKPNQNYSWDCPLNTQGSIKLQGTFTPQYTKPTMDVIEKNLSSVPFKAIGTVGGAGMNAASTMAGAAVGIAGVGAGGIKKGGSLLKSFGGATIGGTKATSDRLTGSSSKARTSLEYDDTPNVGYTTIQSNTPSTPSGLDTATRSIKETPTTSTSAISNGGTPTAATAVRKSRASSFARTLAPSGTYEGTINIISAENIAKHVQIKISLTQSGRMKSLYKTRNQKVNEKGLAQFGESCKFKASPEANIVLTAISRHLLGKDKDAGVAQVLLSDPKVQAGENLAVKIGSGQLVIQINYGQTATNTPPPVPEVPQEYA
ncbi:similar to Saccharomyces cerevisiae YML072C TCB3 Lipid-binding protein, localized to the bud via specific mRNA transport [Maudiozyma saulgeensis]|uniref:Similar to Saccharomyces cerevisiae YML072C TCB3 Lipid-binding protein, localized to the bud via specific mRNA transport n=1 Tax=Maudiozyma saulgeensis TaxID=1789683 RepID=A0A1X7QZ76_9SACH|nr:similar to Saccharomyces cerevisiae YML072C TCB3 Lipid-binding protein, localized to the bud via specific mRNA transport [Kazachstania saulgeensis]